MTTISSWIGNVFLKVVITNEPQWYKEYPHGAFAQLEWGNSIEAHNRYVFVTSDEELAELGMDEDAIVSYWRRAIKERLGLND